MVARLLIIATAVVMVIASDGRSPNADEILEFKETNGSFFANSIYEDAIIDVPGLILKYGYPSEVHHVVTKDKYILEAHRIPYGKYSNNQPGKKTVALLMHGLSCSSADFVTQGPKISLGYFLADHGYDVWIANARGNYYSRRHVHLDPDKDLDFWDFTWEEIGLHDLPAFLRLIHRVTGQEKVHYIGHSQGGTVFLVLNSMKPWYNRKFISFQGMGPASHFAHNQQAIYTFRVYELVESLSWMLGIGEVLTKRVVTVGKFLICGGLPIFDPECIQNVLFFMNDWQRLNTTMLPIFLGHTPAGAAFRQITHFAQIIRRASFARFNYNMFKNLQLYGSIYPPEYDVSKVTAPTYLYYGMGDLSVNYKDLLWLAEHLGNTKEAYRIARDNFRHVEFIWGPKVRTEVYERMLLNMKKAEQL